MIIFFITGFISAFGGATRRVRLYFVSIGRSVRDDFLVVGGHLLDLSEEGYK